MNVAVQEFVEAARLQNERLSWIMGRSSRLSKGWKARHVIRSLVAFLDLFAIMVLQPLLTGRWYTLRRAQAIRALEKSHASRVITMIHRHAQLARGRSEQRWCFAWIETEILMPCAMIEADFSPAQDPGTPSKARTRSDQFGQHVPTCGNSSEKFCAMFAPSHV
jgi:hypothetical protein